LVRCQRVARVIVAMAERRGKLPTAELLKLKARGVLIQDGADYFESITGKVPIEAMRLSWLLFSPGFHPSRVRLLYKRIFSLAFAFLVLVLASPLMAIIAFLIRLDSPGPVIYRQKRVGKDGKTFTLYKFRSMQDGADRGGKHAPAQEGDARITRVGNWLRRTRLDEVPQLYNILRGDMYFVGPRPFVPDQEENLAQQIPFYRQRWMVKPGATGWAQVHRGYCASLEDNAEKLAYDLFYVKNMSIGLDLLILFQTIKILILGRGGR
jgi:exopolysaccharide biosynthesis polyprenyl glycosylphosphotransferase